MLYFRFTVPRWNLATAFHVGEDRGEEIFAMLFASPARRAALRDYRTR
jgi:hypothetical protein